MSKICLNMIVKNESKIIERLLESVFPLIDSYCICDTGSTDNTIEIIESFFESKKEIKRIDGIVVNEPFRDFGYNRTFALKQCLNLQNADYLLLIDADMILTVDPDLDITAFKETLSSHDAYFVFQGSDAFLYKNVRILKNNADYSYWGVTHEYVKTPSNTKYELIPRSQIFIKDIGDGGSKTEKFTRDVTLLKRGLEEFPDNDRYTFYLANSYRDLKDYANAIKTYKDRIKIGGWKEEIWYSYYSIGKCYRDMDDIANAIYYWLEAYNFLPERAENIYEIINHYRSNEKYKLAHSFYKLADSIKEKTQTTDDHLFLQKDVYEYKLDYEFSIIGYYHNPTNIDMSKISMAVISHKTVDAQIISNIISNYKFYSPKLCDTEHKKHQLNIGDSLNIDKTEFVASTPSICQYGDDNSLAVVLRHVNYRIGERGEYTNRDKIETINVLALFDASLNKIKETILKYDDTLDNDYVGLEDVRITSSPKGNLIYNANRGLSRESMVVENGIINVESGETVSSHIMTTINQKEIEKNWVLFHGDNSELYCIYGWYPLKIGTVDNPFRLDITYENPTPPFFKMVRGSTNGILVGEDEIWFICHLVSYEERRYYYHLFVVLDVKTYNVKKYSKLFSFEGAKVEYTLGFVCKNDQFMIGYSVMDREPKYISIAKSSVDTMMIDYALSG